MPSVSPPVSLLVPPTMTPLSLFTVVAGTAMPDHAEIVRTHCRQGASVELRRARSHDLPAPPLAISVWLPCRSLMGLLSVRKKIGYVPAETAELLEPLLDERARIVAHGKVKTVYAPVGRDEAVVTVEVVSLTQKPGTSPTVAPVDPGP